MRYLILATILWLAAIQAASAQATSGRDPFAAIHWTKDCKDAADETTNRRPLGLCDGVVFGVAWTTVGREFCPPTSFTMLQSLKVASRFIDENPARLHEPLPALILAALKEAWPCGRRAPS